MAGYTSEGKVENLKTSIERHIRQKLELEEGFTIHYEGLNFEEDSSSEWIQENILSTNLEEQYDHKDHSGNRRKLVVVALNFNIFVKKTSTTKTNRHYEIRDALGEYYNVGHTINLYDAVSENFSSSIQTMKIKEIITDEVIPSDDIYQYNYTIGIEWLRKWT